MKLLEWTPGRWFHPEGCLWLDRDRTLVIADVHLGYSFAQRRRGELGPPVDEVTAARLNRVVTELAPETVLFLGDLVHAPRPSPDERALIERTIGQLAERAKLVNIPGNHDRRMAREFSSLPMDFTLEYESGGLYLVHGDRPPPRAPWVAGHLHPVWGFRDRGGARQRVRVFVESHGNLILPAFSPFAAGHDLRKSLPDFWRPLLRGSTVLYAATGEAVIPLGPRTPSRGSKQFLPVPE